MNKLHLTIASTAILSSFATAVQYKVVDLGQLIPNSRHSEALDINNNGQIIGRFTLWTGETGGFMWSPTTGMRILTIPASETQVTPVAISGDGTIVGYSYGVEGQSLIRWNQQNQYEFIQHSSFIPNPTVLGINSSGIVLGNQGGNNGEGFIVGGGVDFQYLGTLPSGVRQMIADDINDQGQVAGKTYLNGKYYATIYDPLTGVRAIGTSSGHPAKSTAINGRSQIIGNAGPSTADEKGFLWDPTTGLTSMGVLSGTRSSALGLNDLGVVVGWSDVEGGRESTIWNRREGLRSLRSVIVHNPQNLFMISASAINNDGWIVSKGSSPSLFGGTAVVLQPVPEPASIFGLTAGAMVLLRRKRSRG